MADDTRLRIKCAAVGFANDYGPLPAANLGDDTAQEQIADRLISMLRQSGLKIIKTRQEASGDPYMDAVRDLNNAAYAAMRACKDTTRYPMVNRHMLREIAAMADKLVDAGPDKTA